MDAMKGWIAIVVGIVGILVMKFHFRIRWVVSQKKRLMLFLVETPHIPQAVALRNTAWVNPEKPMNADRGPMIEEIGQTAADTKHINPQ